MSSSRLMASHDLGSLHQISSHKSRLSHVLNPPHLLKMDSRSNHGFNFSANQGFLSLNNCNSKMGTIVCNGFQPGSQPSTEEAHNSIWIISWVSGMLLSIILPFSKNIWASLLVFKKEVDAVVDTAESVADMVEKVAEEVEKVADEVEDKLPDGGKLKEVVHFVEDMAKETVKDVEQAEGIIHKVEEMEDKVEAFMDQINQQDGVPKKGSIEAN